jgi:hypothetical protein
MKKTEGRKSRATVPLNIAWLKWNVSATILHKDAQLCALFIAKFCLSQVYDKMYLCDSKDYCRE